MFEDLRIEWIERRPYISFFLGIFYVFIGYIIASIFFKENISIAMLFLATLLIVPTMAKLITVEEKRESKEGLRHFFYNHKDIFEAYIFMFLGLFFGYMLLGFIFSGRFETIFQFQLDFLKNQEGLSSELLKNFFASKISPTISHVGGIVSNNLVVMIICFILSLFYGAGAIFLVALNASIFSSFIIFLIENLSNRLIEALYIIGFFSLHLIPEIGGFIIAALAGGVVSKALVTEKRKSLGFRNVMKDSLMLLFISFILIIFAAFVEVYITTNLFYKFF